MGKKEKERRRHTETERIWRFFILLIKKVIYVLESHAQFQMCWKSDVYVFKSLSKAVRIFLLIIFLTHTHTHKFDPGSQTNLTINE